MKQALLTNKTTIWEHSYAKTNIILTFSIFKNTQI